MALIRQRLHGFFPFIFYSSQAFLFYEIPPPFRCPAGLYVAVQCLYPAQCPREKGKVNWVSINEAIDLAKQEPRKIIVDVYADWCGWCKKMDKTTFQHPDIAEYINEKYYAVKFDAEHKQPITVGAETFKYRSDARGGVHELALTLLEGQINLPSVVVLDNKLSKLTIIPGYMEPVDMDKALRYFGDGYYDKNIKWGVFEKNFRSNLGR